MIIFCRFLIASLAAVVVLSSMVAGGCPGMPGFYGQPGSAGQPGSPGFDGQPGSGSKLPFNLL